MLTTSIKAGVFTFLIIFTWINSAISAESINNSYCEFTAYDGEAGEKKVKGLIATVFVEDAFKESNPKFEKLDSTIKMLSNQDCKLLDGQPTLNFIVNGFKEAYKRINPTLVLPKIHMLQKAHPEAAYPFLAEATYWIDYAWVARGGGFASSVTEENWKLFYARMKNAQTVLIRNKVVGSTMPAWYEYMVKIQMMLDDSQEEQDKIFFEGVERYKNFLPLYISKRNALEPKWGGSWEAIDKFINWSVNNTKDTQGLRMYALLYFGVHDNMLADLNFWKETLVKWPKFKQGLEDLTRLAPKSQYNLNIYASMACEANDKKTYLKVRSKISEPIVWNWQYYSSVDICDAKYGFKKLH